MTTYGYARVSSKDQNLDRQLDQLKAIGVEPRNIFCDKASGKNFNRPSWDNLIDQLEKGDLLVVVSLDRMGRNYTEIKEQWQHITHDIGADIKVLDMPMLDTTKTNDSLDRRFIADLVLQILSYTAEKERKNIHARQEQGIKAAQERNVKFGRPAAQFPDGWEQTYKAWKDGQITATAAMDSLNLKRTTFYKLAKQYEQKK
jgi:DNA invertase Pin-like site-specific DNA recombinase